MLILLHTLLLQAVLSSGRGALSRPTPACTVPSCTVLQQPLVATIKIEDGAGQAQPQLQVSGVEHQLMCSLAGAAWVLAVCTVSAHSTDYTMHPPSMQPEGCTPLRPSYVSDLSDAALAFAGASDKVSGLLMPCHRRSKQALLDSLPCLPSAACSAPPSRSKRLPHQPALSCPTSALPTLQVVRGLVRFDPVNPDIASEDCQVNGAPFSVPDRECLLVFNA